MIAWDSFFPAGTPVLALPSWEAPRVYLASTTVAGRWRSSALFPASRLRARVYRWAMRLRAAIAPLGTRQAAPSGPWPLASFLADICPEASAAALLVGTPGPAQKFTVALQDKRGAAVGYLKVGTSKAAQRRLRQEWDVLQALPDGLGPGPLKTGPLLNGYALLMAPVGGRPLRGTLPPPPALLPFCERLAVRPDMDAAAHPGLRHLRYDPIAAAWLAALEGRQWPVVIRHGDLAAWNLRRHRNGLTAFDWEYGTLEGFPYLDLAYYILQLGALIYRWKPEKAYRQAVRYLTEQARLSVDEAAAVVRLSARDAYLQTEADGHPPTWPIQAWRVQVWQRPSSD